MLQSHNIHHSNPCLSTGYCSSSACLLFEVYQLCVVCLSSVISITQSLPSCWCSSVMSVTWRLSSTPNSVNSHFLLSCHLFELCSHGPFCFLSLHHNIRHIWIRNPSLHPRPISCPAPHYVRYTKQLSPPGLSSAFELSYLLLFPSLPSASFCCTAQPLRWICNCESERALCWILNLKPRQTFLPRQNLFISESSPSLVLRAAFAHLTSFLAAIWLCWQQLPVDGRVAITFEMCYSHPCTLKLILFHVTAFSKNSLPFSRFISDCHRRFH